MDDFTIARLNASLEHSLGFLGAARSGLSSRWSCISKKMDSSSERDQCENKREKVMRKELHPQKRKSQAYKHQNESKYTGNSFVHLCPFIFICFAK